MRAVLIEGCLYGPFTEEECGAFCIDYEATFEFYPKPEFQIFQLVKITGGSAAEIHVPPIIKGGRADKGGQ